MLAALVAALLVPMGFALSLESPAATAAAYSRSSPIVANTSTSMPTAMLVQTRVSPHSIFDTVSDAGKLLVVGASLIGLAAFMRRSA